MNLAQLLMNLYCSGELRIDEFEEVSISPEGLARIRCHAGTHAIDVSDNDCRLQELIQGTTAFAIVLNHHKRTGGADQPSEHITEIGHALNIYARSS